MAITNTAITTSAASIFTSTGNNAITTIIICNTGVTDRTLTMHAVPSGSSVSSTNMIVNALNIPAGETMSFDQEKIVLGNGDQVDALASGTGLSATVSTLAV